MVVTIKDVAQRAGVSLITVSRVINGSSYVHRDTRARVEAAIEELQYVPNRLASNLRSRQSDTIALLLPDITNSFWTSIARGVEDEAWAHGYGMFLCNTDDDPVKEGRYVDILLRRQVEGILIVPTPASVPHLQRLQRRGIKFVVLHRKIEGVEADVVRGDSRAGVRALTEQLLGAGLRRIAYVGGSGKLAFGHERLAGYRETLRAAGVKIDPALIKVGSYSQQTGYQLVEALVQLDPRPEAIVVANSRLAMGALRALSEAGLRVPQDIAVASFHDISLLDDYAPRMTTATQPAYDIGRLGARRLFERRSTDRSSPEEIVLPNRITVRGLARVEPSKSV
ncbi:MAG: LacI family DNA-binding transcriptional regulator [Thermomicrobiales bacterium]